MQGKRPYHELSNLRRFRKSNRRKNKLERRKKGWYSYYYAVRVTAKAKNKKLQKPFIPSYAEASRQRRFANVPKPEHSDNIKFLAENRNAFSKQSALLPEDGVFFIPDTFSLTENYEESFLFLKKLFYSLYNDKFERVKLDYINCNRIDLDASVCMDTLLAEFFRYHRLCTSKNIPTKLITVTPVNYGKVEKVLFSIGAYKNLRKFERSYPDIIPFSLMVGDNYSKRLGQEKEIEVTKMVDYIVQCLARTNRSLTWQAEDDLSKVVGEVLINAAEHCGRRYRYSIGYFQEINNNREQVGIFNLVIFDFGKTIYENFKNLENTNSDIVKRMKELSANYTSRGLFKIKEFEEETLWTLYALQEGVTSVQAKKRGNGSIHFIESFFQLKGDLIHDKSSYLTIMSGNTRIVFDGKYQICKVPRGKDKTVYKMMTFNDTNNIEDPPDKNCVTFTENFFPGTLIVAKIFIKYKNIEKEEE